LVLRQTYDASPLTYAGTHTICTVSTSMMYSTQKFGHDNVKTHTHTDLP